MKTVWPAVARPTRAIGDDGTFSKTITDRDLRRFAAASGDFNPLHLDEEYARTTRFQRRLAHGVLTAGIISALLAREIPGLGTIFVEMHLRFLKPVFLADVVSARGIVSEITNPKRVRLAIAAVNQHRTEVARGHAIVIPPDKTRVVF